MLTGYLIITQNTLKSMTRDIIERNISQKKKVLILAKIYKTVKYIMQVK